MTTHGLYQHPLYRTWQTMLHRCENPQNKNYRHYGGRGIQVCERWHDPAVFIADVEAAIGPRPAGTYPSGLPLYSFDRRDNDSGYRPGNVRWATAKEQLANRGRKAI